jgi:hypothetical protein
MEQEKSEVSHDSSDENVEFVYQDNTEVKENTEHHKYTEIDCLDEDKPIANQKYVLMSFISPEGIMNCKTRGVKIRGVYATEDEAKNACNKLKSKDKNFDIFVGEVGKWLPWDPSLKQVNEVKFRNDRLDKLMQKMHKSEMENLNELVGRKKEMLEKDKGAHKSRIKDAIIENIEKMDVQDTEEEVIETKQKSTHDGSHVRNRLKKLLEDRDKTKKNEKTVAEKKQNKEKVVNEFTKSLKAETSRFTEKKDGISKLETVSKDLTDKINKMKLYKEQMLNKK